MSQQIICWAFFLLFTGGRVIIIYKHFNYVLQ